MTARGKDGEVENQDSHEPRSDHSEGKKPKPPNNRPHRCHPRLVACVGQGHYRAGKGSRLWVMLR